MLDETSNLPGICRATFPLMVFIAWGTFGWLGGMLMWIALGMIDVGHEFEGFILNFYSPLIWRVTQVLEDARHVTE